jgi:sirohydrochlorin cobaltochelatase
LKEGIVLFAHGSRDPGWAAPFRKILKRLRETLPEAEVRLAYLEVMKPSLGEALVDLSAKVDSIRVVPLFLGYGGHIKKDLPALIAAADPQVKVTIEAPVGEAPQVIEAIAGLIGSRA